MSYTEKEKNAIRGLFKLQSDVADMGKVIARRKRRIRRKIPRCTCGGRPCGYVEIWRNHTISFSTDAAGRPDSDGGLEAGEPYAVDAECGSCGRTWRLRGVTQITDLEDLE